MGFTHKVVGKILGDRKSKNGHKLSGKMYDAMINSRRLDEFMENKEEEKEKHVKP